VNSSDFPIFIISLTSDVLDKRQMYNAASTIVAQKLAQLQGVDR
jgi:multidrug efflux pump